jgi:hypothetical protein
MPSSETPVGNGAATTNDVSSLASLSAKNSLKRSRILYATNPENAFIPTTDPVVLQNSIDRRRKTRIIRNQIDHRQTSGSNGTLAIVAAADNRGGNGSALQMNPVSSSALAIQNQGIGKEDSKKEILKNDNQGGGILVVRFETVWPYNISMET